MVDGWCAECGRPSDWLLCEECDPWTDEDEAALEAWEEERPARIAEANESWEDVLYNEGLTA